MLVLTRKPGEKILIGSGITVTFIGTKGNAVRLAIEAPDDVRILREELAWWHEDDGRDAMVRRMASTHATVED